MYITCVRAHNGGMCTREYMTQGHACMHDVTLGATGTSTDHDRHTKIGRGVFLAGPSALCSATSWLATMVNAVVGAQSLLRTPEIFHLAG